MGFTDLLIYVSIAIVYNLFVHNLASLMFQDQQFDDKQNNTTIMLLVFGFGGIMAPYLMKKFKKYKNKHVSKGLKWGGLLMILTALFVNWDDFGNELRLACFGLLFAGLVWYCYTKN